MFTKSGVIGMGLSTIIEPMVDVAFSDSSKPGAYVVYDITLIDASGAVRVITLVVINDDMLSASNTDESGNVADIEFKPAPGTTLPVGTEIVAKPYAPTEEDLEKIIGAAQPDAKVVTASYSSDSWTTWSLDNEEFFFEYGGKRYYRSEMIEINGTHYYCHVIKKHLLNTKEYEYEVSFFEYPNGKPKKMKLKNSVLTILDLIGASVEITKPNRAISINGVAYTIGISVKYKDNGIIENTLYAEIDGEQVLAGRLETDNDGNAPKYYFYENCTPDKLKKAGSPIAQINKDGKTYNANFLFSSDISLKNGGNVIEAHGKMSLYMSLMPRVGYLITPQFETLLFAHIGIDGSVDIEKALINEKGDLIADLNVGSQSPFIVLALTEAEPFSVPVKTVEAAEQQSGGSPQTGDGSDMWLWIALLLVSGGAVTAAWSCKQKVQKTR